MSNTSNNTFQNYNLAKRRSGFLFVEGDVVLCLLFLALLDLLRLEILPKLLLLLLPKDRDSKSSELKTGLGLPTVSASSQFEQNPNPHFRMGLSGTSGKPKSVLLLWLLKSRLRSLRQKWLELERLNAPSEKRLLLSRAISIELSIFMLASWIGVDAVKVWVTEVGVLTSITWFVQSMRIGEVAFFFWSRRSRELRSRIASCTACGP